MKKILLSVAAVFAAMSVNAQEIAVIDADAIGIGADAVELAAGTELMKTESVTCSILFTDNFKATGLSENNVTVNDVDFGSTTGIQGSTNPPAAATEGTYPEQGCIYSFVPSKDGFLYVIHKASANKNYVVWENKLRVPYIFSAADGGAYDLNTIEGATVTVDGITNIADEYVIAKAQEIIGTEGLGAGTCVIKVQVFKDCQYDVHATGSKMTMAGFIFDETGDATIKAGDVTLLDKGQIPGAEPAPAAPVYSVIGTLVGGWEVVNDVDMQLVNGLYSATIDIEAAGSYEWKIRQDHDWTINWGDAGDGTGVQDGPNFIAEMPANSSITITFDPATAKIDAFVVGGVIEPIEGGEAIIGEIDWTQQEAFNNWCSGENGSTAVVGAEGLEINVPAAGDNYWNPQTVVLNIEGEKVADNPDAPAILAEDGQYKVVIVAKHPAGHLQVNLGTWDDGVSLQKDFDVEEAADFHEIVVDFSEGWPADCFSNVHVLWQSGSLPGLSVLKSIQIIDLNATAIKTVKTGKKFEGAIYNLAGQKVNASYKGVVIKDGKKYIQK